MTLKTLIQSSGSTALAAILAMTALPLDAFAAGDSDRGGQGQWSQRGGHAGGQASGNHGGGNRGGGNPGGGHRGGAPNMGNANINWGNGPVRVPRTEPRGDFRPRQVEAPRQPRPSPAPNWAPRTPDRPVVATPTWNTARPDRAGNDSDRNGRGRDGTRGHGNWQGGQTAGNNDGPRDGDRAHGGWRGHGGSRGQGNWQGGQTVGSNDGPRVGDNDRPRWQRDRNRSYSDRNRNRDYRNHDRDNFRHGSRDWHDRDRHRGNDGWRSAYRHGGHRNHRGWNHGWRNDNRYDWYGYRNNYGDIYRIGRYHSPYRHHSYSRLSAGFYLDSLFFSSQYWIDDPWRYRLPDADGSYRWVRYYDDALLVDVYTGEVVDVIHDFFW